MNRFNSFISSPAKYATGSSKAKDKILYLDGLFDQMNSYEQFQYEAAKQIYEAAIAEKSIPKESINTSRNIALIQEALQKNQILTIVYKGFTRDIYPYASDGKYCVAYCTINEELRTFRIDRMEKVSATGIFTAKQSLLDDAESKIATAPTFRNYRSYKRY